MLRKIRITLALVCFVFVTLLFLDFTGTFHAWFGWLAKIQFLPAVLALNVGVVALLAVLTRAGLQLQRPADELATANERLTVEKAEGAKAQ